MRIQAAAAVLYTIRKHYKLSAACLTQCIEWTIAEQTIEIIRFAALMAGKIFTFLICKVGIILFHAVSFLSTLDVHYHTPAEFLPADDSAAAAGFAHPSHPELPAHKTST